MTEPESAGDELARGPSDRRLCRAGSVALPDGKRARVYASSGVDRQPFPEIFNIPDGIVRNESWEHEITDDLPSHPVWRNQESAKRGYRSALRVAIRVEGGEPGVLGVDVSERTVSRLLERCPRPPSQTWRTFLTNHLASAASMDFFTVPTLTGLDSERGGLLIPHTTADALEGEVGAP